MLTNAVCWGELVLRTLCCVLDFSNSLTRTYRKSRQVIRVEASTAAEGLVTEQNVWILQQRQLSWGQSFTQLLRFYVRPSLPVHDCIQQAFGRDSPLCG